ncbi:hypothetical protein [uncultured Roseobacter sp.]|uniref:hypothetical protein n=1 Tax=uncultured Roseobacter sp. TaxID=114847 RepID=UPI00260C37A2|nr:hypothetical protein [uncultured Roseobacter sp.]
MRVRKGLTASQRFSNLGYGVVGMIIAVVIARYGDFEFSGTAAFVIGLIAAGGIFRGVFGFDEV